MNKGGDSLVAGKWNYIKKLNFGPLFPLKLAALLLSTFYGSVLKLSFS